MLGALGVNQAWLFTAVFALGCFLAGLGGALQGPRMPANLAMDLDTIGNAFVVVVVGGMGSIGGAFAAALLIAEIKALCIALGNVSLFGMEISLSRLTLVVEFLVMAAVLVVRPWGLFGKPPSTVRASGLQETPLRRAGRAARLAGWTLMLLLLALPLLAGDFPYLPVLMVEILVAVLFAASLHFLMGPGGMLSFGHAAYFGLGAYAAALVTLKLQWPMPAAMATGALTAMLGALLFGWFCVRLSGVYLAMLTLAFAQIVWALIFQWDDFTGGSNGLVGIRAAEAVSSPLAYYYLALACAVLGVTCYGGSSMRRSAWPYVPPAMPRRAPRRWAWMCVPAMGWLCRGGPLLRTGRCPFRLLQGQYLARGGRCGPLGRWPGDGHAGRRAKPAGPLAGSGAVYLAARPGGARDRLLARLAGRRDPAAGVALPGRCRRSSGARTRRRRMSLLRAYAISPSPSGRGRAGRRVLRSAGRPDAGADRAQRRWQVDLLQCPQRPAGPERRCRAARWRGHRRPRPPPDLAAWRGTHIPGLGRLCLHDRPGKRPGCLALAPSPAALLAPGRQLPARRGHAPAGAGRHGDPGAPPAGIGLWRHQAGGAGYGAVERATPAAHG
jgi:ABC-type branched-subunit amino acid transport system permease subunit